MAHLNFNQNSYDANNIEYLHFCKISFTGYNSNYNRITYNPTIYLFRALKNTYAFESNVF